MDWLICFQEGGLDENSERAFYESSENSEEEEAGSDEEKKKPYVMDMDHRLLLKTCKPLLNSRNGSVSIFCYASDML